MLEVAGSLISVPYDCSRSTLFEERVLSVSLSERIRLRCRPLIMHPAVFIGLFVCVGLCFALQDWMAEHAMELHKIGLPLLMRAWGVQFFLLGTLCWLIWFWLGPRVQQASLGWMLTRLIPLSLLVAFSEELLWVALFPSLPLNHPHMSYWRRVTFQLDAEAIDSILIIWAAFLVFRGAGYYQRFREKETAAAHLAAELAHAQIRALRMQLNPHFLFNTMNSISSLMQVDVAAADTMLEQLSSILRITLERGDTQLIPLSDEMEFLEMYLALQDRRFAGRVEQRVHVDPTLHDALVPAMLLQPIVENAFTHGLSRLDEGGQLCINVTRDHDRMNIRVANNGLGLNPEPRRDPSTQGGVGLTNVRSRLKLHYGPAHQFSIAEPEKNLVAVTLSFPLQFSASPTPTLTGYGV